ncbi:MAG: methyltransferase domain-containing protein [Ktedonobacterales bacterium]|nr:methyltransferase domain-containing protein [Ktedonobacterales bacterium]
MIHEDHVTLLRDGVVGGGRVWADLGAGTGAFTLALADLLGPDGEIYAVDKDRGALSRLGEAMRARFPAVAWHALVADFARPLSLASLDGVVMANSLHFVRQKDSVLQLVRGYLKPGGRLLLVEYNADRGNPWVPHPLSYETWVGVARHNGFPQTRLLARVPSRFLREIYSALSW